METPTLFTAETADDVIKCLERGDNINERINGDTPFIVHCEHNNIDVVIELLKHNCNVLSDHPGENSGIESICQLGHSNLLRQILQYDTVRALLNPNNKIFTPLNLACGIGHSDIFDILIEYGADFNLPNINGRTPLIAACDNSQIDIVKKLLQLGAKVNKRNNLGRTSIFYCKNVNILHLLYINGADINIQDNFGNTPLMVFAKSNDYEAVEALINICPDLNIRNKNGETALITSLISRNIDIVKRLLEANADVNIIDINGNTAYDYIG